MPMALDEQLVLKHWDHLKSPMLWLARCNYSWLCWTLNTSLFSLRPCRPIIPKLLGHRCHHMITLWNLCKLALFQSFSPKYWSTILPQQTLWVYREINLIHNFPTSPRTHQTYKDITIFVCAKALHSKKCPSLPEIHFSRMLLSYFPLEPDYQIDGLGWAQILARYIGFSNIHPS